MAVLTFQKYASAVRPPVRFGIAVMLFMACVISYMFRVNLSINIIAMVHDRNHNGSQPDTGPRYDWDVYEQGLLLGSYFWGYLMTSLIGGVLAETLGGKEVAGYTLVASVILTALSPIAANWHFWILFAIRFLIGVLGGVLYPCCHYLVSRWAPPSEKGKFVASLMGGTFGTVITWPISGLIIQAMGWDWAFYMVAIFSAVVVVVWFVVISNSPSSHKWITEEERKYIEDALSSALSGKKKWPPYLRLALSPPFWALLLLHFGNMWGLYFLITAAPKFMSEALGFNLKSAGFLSSLPYLARLLFGFLFGGIGDFIQKKNFLTTTKIRKIFCIFSHIIPGAFLILLSFVNSDPYVCVAIITLSLGFNGAATLTNLQNSQDLAPNYAGTLYGVINFFGTLPGIFSPLIVAYFTQHSKSVTAWAGVFYIGAGAYILPAIFFVVFGSGEIQPWNYSSKTDEKSETKL